MSEHVESNKQTPGILYHRIASTSGGKIDGLTISPARFERQIAWLARRGYTGICATDWALWRRGEVQLPHKPIFLTFDDAYEDIATYAFPVLQKYRFKATTFVVTGQVGGSNIWDSSKGTAPMALMNLEQIRYWSQRGIEFGAHSRSHADLTTLSQADCRREIEGSKSELAGMLGTEVRAFAYPYGKVSESVHRVVSESYDVAFGVQEGMNDLGTDPHLLNRIYIGPSYPMIEFAVGVHRGKLEPLPSWRGKLRIRSRLEGVARKLSSKNGIEESGS